MEKRTSTVTTEENYLNTSKNYAMVDLYKKIKEILFDNFENVGTGATSYYVHWNVIGIQRTRQFVNFYVQNNKIGILTLPPVCNYNVGETVPDTHGWTLNYRTDIFSESDIEKVKEIIIESYNQIE